MDLLSPRRFDILAKYIYAKGKEDNYDSSFYIDVYREHLSSWNNIYSEFDKKYNLDDYLNSFDTILTSFKENGFDNNISQIPIIKDTCLSPLNGAHRTAAAILYDTKVSCIPGIIQKDGMLCDFNYLKDKGLDSHWLDMMALEYAKLKDDTFVVSLFPSCTGTNDNAVRDILKNAGEIVYEKDIYLWDVAAGMSLVKEAGGEVFYRNTDGKFKYEVLASNKKIFKKAKEMLIK